MTQPKKQSIDWLTVRAFLKASKRYKPAFYYAWLTPISTVCLSIVIPFFVGRILAGLAHSSASVNGSVVGLVVAGVVAIVINRFAFSQYLAWQARVMADLQTVAIKHLMYRGTSFHNDNIGGKLVSDAVDYPAAFLRFTDAIFTNILPFAAVLVTGVLLISIEAPLIGLTVFLMSALAIFSAIRFRLSMAPYRHKRLLAGKAVTAHIADTISNNQTVKAFSREAYELEKHHRLNDVLLGHRLHDWHKLATNGNNRIIGLFLFELVFVITIIHQIHHHPALLAAGIFAFSYTVTLTNRLFDIGTMMRAIEEALLQAEPMTTILQAAHEIIDVPHAVDLRLKDGAVTFSDVTFHYTDSSGDTVFENLNIRIKAGEKVGLVGPSGGGKSTLTKLLLRFEDIADGTIMIDDQAIDQVTQESLRKAIGYVAQEPLLFHRTISENISYGRPDASQEEIEEAAKKAYAFDFIQALPKRFDTVVGERGVKLSGGQRQRIAIARAILKDAPILVLDEATSALDSESEKVIQKALWELMDGKTAIVIAHRLSTIQRLDRIIVLDAGQIVEDGTHSELLRRNGLYARLWKHQSGGFIEE